MSVQIKDSPLCLPSPALHWSHCQSLPYRIPSVQSRLLWSRMQSPIPVCCSASIICKLAYSGQSTFVDIHVVVEVHLKGTDGGIFISWSILRVLQHFSRIPRNLLSTKDNVTHFCLVLGDQLIAQCIFVKAFYLFCPKVTPYWCC